MSAIREMIIIIAVLTAVLIAGIKYNDTENAAKKAQEEAKQQAAAEALAAAHSAEYLDYTLTPDGVIITKNFENTSLIRLPGVELCSEKPAANSGYSSSFSCYEEKCGALFDFDQKPIPRELTIDRKYNGKCVKQSLTGLEKYRIYREEITINATLAKKLNLSDRTSINIRKTAGSKYANSTIRQKNAGLVVDLEYGEVKPQDDEFIIGSRTITVLYNFPAAR